MSNGHKGTNADTELNNKTDETPEIMDVDPEYDNENEATATADTAQDEPETLEKQFAETQAQLEKEKKEYLFLMAEFDNFRKRTLKEKAELIRNGAENAMKGLLPIIDDFERGLDAMKDSSDADAVKEGMTLIYNKFVKYLNQNGVKVMDSTGADFDPDHHEAIALVPVDDEALKGKVIDTVSKGYMLNDKVLRHAKVAVGQ
ncbi:MAG: nucleotide exchange factor GrpE [Muribaculaceae bacterium]|nr:nucleotide exchange factor GrpE [Muribaculaceae bacterium]